MSGGQAAGRRRACAAQCERHEILDDAVDAADADGAGGLVAAQRCGGAAAHPAGGGVATFSTVPDRRGRRGQRPAAGRRRAAAARAVVAADRACDAAHERAVNSHVDKELGGGRKRKESVPMDLALQTLREALPIVPRVAGSAEVPGEPRGHVQRLACGRVQAGGGDGSAALARWRRGVLEEAAGVEGGTAVGDGMINNRLKGRKGS